MDKKDHKGNYVVKHKHALIDALKAHLNCDTDTKLSDIIDAERTYLSRIRIGISIVSDNFMLLVHEITGWPFSTIRELRYKSNLNVPRPSDSVQLQIAQYEEYLRVQFNKGVQNGNQKACTETRTEASKTAP
jgi:hypothetical protein